MKIPEQKSGSSFKHNEHQFAYKDLRQWIADNDLYVWENNEAKQRAINSNEMWTLFRYPTNLVAETAKAAPTFDELLKIC